MSLSEFALIKKYFFREYSNEHIRLGSGDDCALVIVPDGLCQALSMDTLVAGVHFPLDTQPADIAYKSLAVNLSDLAAMGASPLWFSLALTMPEVNECWLSEFSAGLFELADAFSLPLVGGDITKGPLSITIQIAGSIDERLALRRDGACEGDCVFVSGVLGEAAAGLSILQNAGDRSGLLQQKWASNLIDRLNRPSPRVALGKALLNVATSCIDVSDGLLADLSHLCDRSQLGAEVDVTLVPLSGDLNAYIKTQNIDDVEKTRLMLGAGDDYELCFTAPEGLIPSVKKLAKETGVSVAVIGQMVPGNSVSCVMNGGESLDIRKMGFKHF